jgi:hypothetical protein
MHSFNIPLSEITRAVVTLGIEFAYTPEQLDRRGTRWKFRLVPGPTIANPTAPHRMHHKRYQRMSASWSGSGRRIHALCWHGFRDFFRLCYLRNPRACFRTRLDTWRSREDFEARYIESGYRNIGPAIAPVQFREACFCWQTGEDYDPGSDWYAQQDGYVPTNAQLSLIAEAS